MVGFTTKYEDRTNEIINLFKSTFAASEGSGEGEVIATLVINMLTTAAPRDIFVFLALEHDISTGAIIFTRLSYPDDSRTVFVLGPVAVVTGQQGRGLGQSLLNHGLNELRGHGVDVAITYGDIRFYSKVGFVQITESVARPPWPLGQPEGWLAQSLTDKPLSHLKGPSHCVEALNRPEYW